MEDPRNQITDIPKQKVMVATPLYNSQGFGNYIRSLVKAVGMMEQLKIKTNFFDYKVLIPEGDAYVHNVRNMIAREFLKTDCTHLLFWDSDVQVDAVGFARILKANKDVVGAAFKVKNAWGRWSVHLEKNENGMLLRDPETGLYKARRIATGFLKISRRVFETLAEKDPENYYLSHIDHTKVNGFFNFYNIGKTILREDYGFCERCYNVGIPIWCETRVVTGHFGMFEWTGCLHEYFNINEEREIPEKYTVY